MNAIMHVSPFLYRPLLPPIPIPIFSKKMVSKRSSSSGTPGANKSVKRSVSPIPGSMEVDE